MDDAMMSKSVFKRFLRICLMAFAGLIVLMLIGYGLVQTPMVQNALKRQVINAAQSQMGGRLEIHRISGNLLTTLSFHGINLSVKEASVLAADRITLSYSLPMLLTKTIWIHRLNIDGLNLKAHRDPDGSWNFDPIVTPISSTTPSSPSSSSYRMVLERLEVENSAVSVMFTSDAATDSYRITDVRLVAGLNLDDAATIQVRQAAFSLIRPRISVTEVKGNLFYDAEEGILALKKFRISTPKSILSLNIDLELNAKDPRINAAATLTPLSLSDVAQAVSAPELDRGDIQGSISAKGTLQQMRHYIRLHHRQQELTLQGETNYHPGGRLDVATRGAINRFDLLYWMPKSGASGKSNLNATLAFKGDHLLDAARSGRLDITLHDTTLFDIPQIHGRLASAFDHDHLEVTEAHLDSPIGGLTFSSRVSGLVASPQKHVELSVELTDADLSQILPEFNLTGTVNGDLQIDASGKLDPDTPLGIGSWTAKLQTRIDSSIVMAAAVNSADLQADWDGRRVQLHAFALSSDPVSADLHGVYTPADASFQVEGTAHVHDLQKLSEMLRPFQISAVDHLSPTGDLRISATCTGRPEQYDITATAVGGQLSVAGLTATEAKLKGNLGYGTADVNGRLTVSFDTVSVTGQLLERVKWDAHLTAKRISAQLSAQHAMGMAQLTGSIDGWALPEKTIELDILRITPPQSAEKPLFEKITNIDPIRMRLLSDGLEVEAFKLASDFGMVTAEGKVGGDGTHRLQLDINALNLTRLNAVIGSEWFPAGWLSARVKATGTLPEPQMTSQIAFSRDASALQTAPDIRAEMAYDQRILNVSLTARQGGRRLVSVTGQNGLHLTLRPFIADFIPNSLDATIEIDNAALSVLPLPAALQDMIGGTVAGKAQATGDVFSPQLTGRFSVKEGTLALKKWNLNYAPISVDVRMVPGELHIDRLHYAGKNDGNLTGSGTVGFKGLTPTTLDLKLSGRRLIIPYKGAITTQLDPDLRLTGQMETPHLGGKITIREARISLEQILSQSPSEIEVVGEATGIDRTIELSDDARTSDRFVDRLSAELAVEANRNVWIKGQGLDAEISGNLKIKKAPLGSARLIGKLETVRGRYDFYGRRFTVTKGRIDFIGAPQPDPYIDIQAESQIKDVTVILNITRKAGKVEIELSSRPEMLQSDIISYLVFGKSRDELRGQQSAGAELSAMSVSGKIAAAELEKILGETGVVDTFSIDTGGEDWTSGSASVGKYVTQELFVIYRYQFSANTPNEVLVDYQLNKNFSVKSQFGNEKTTGIDFIWQHDFNNLSPD